MAFQLIITQRDVVEYNPANNNKKAQDMCIFEEGNMQNTNNVFEIDI